MVGLKRISAFVLDNGLNSLGIVRSLGRHQIPVYVFGQGKERYAFKSRYTTAIELKDQLDTDAVVDSLLEVSSRLDHKPVLFFTSDFFLKLASGYYDTLSKYFLIQLPSPKAVETVANKKKFADFVVKNDFPVPQTYIPTSISEVVELADTLEYPVILKPSESYQWRKMGFKVTYIENKETLIEKWQELQNSCDDLLIQQVIEGPDEMNYSYCAYRRPEQGEILSICINKIRLVPVHGGVGTLIQVVADKEIEDIGRRILEALQYVGIGSVSFKKDTKTGKPYIYEVNGRLPQWHTAFQMCGYDLPYIMYRDIIQSPIEVPTQVRNYGKWTALQLDTHAFIGYRRQGELGLWAWLKSFRGLRMCAEFAWDDWGPLGLCLKQLAVKGIKQLRKNNGSINNQSY
jgi:D-aspartate ligase